jgi:hypothetical protein
MINFRIRGRCGKKMGLSASKISSLFKRESRKKERSISKKQLTKTRM